MTLWDLIGKLAFVVGLLMAFFGGIWGGESVPENDAVVAILLICGILIALLNITTREASTVLIATVALVIVSIWGTIQEYYFLSPSYPIYHLSKAVWENTIGIVSCLAILMVPSAVIISIKAIIATANRD